jgi:hypothetical protein
MPYDYGYKKRIVIPTSSTVKTRLLLYSRWWRSSGAPGRPVGHSMFDVQAPRRVTFDNQALPQANPLGPLSAQIDEAA